MDIVNDFKESDRRELDASHPPVHAFESFYIKVPDFSRNNGVYVVGLIVTIILFPQISHSTVALFFISFCFAYVWRPIQK